ncbi:MAG: PAS domain-containing protein [Candidatus Margulisiibacteriota bacterium]
MGEKLQEDLKAKTILDAMPVAVGIMDMEGKIRDVNPEFERGSGWKKEEALGKTALELGYVSKAEFRRMEKEIVPELMKKGFVRNIETTFICKNKELKSALMSWTLMKDAAGRPKGVINVARDISSLKRAQKELKESEQKYRDIFDNASDLIVLLDTSGKFVDVNQRAEQVFGWKKEELVGKRFWEVGFLMAQDGPKYMKMFLEYVKTGMYLEIVELSIRTKTGEIKHVEANTRMLKRDNKPWRSLAIIRDITERKAAEEKLKKNLQEIEKLNTFMLGREGKIIELKKEVNKLLKDLGRPAKYKE